MTFTIILITNTLLATALLGLLAFAMSRPAKLTPHKAGATPEARRRRRSLQLHKAAPAHVHARARDENAKRRLSHAFD